MSNKKAQATHMYHYESCIQRHIATITDNLYAQIFSMQQTIAQRAPGKQFPTPQEAAIALKLVNCIHRLNPPIKRQHKQPSGNQNTAVPHPPRTSPTEKEKRAIFAQFLRNLYNTKN